MLFLLLVTIISLLLTVIMSVIAWRAAHEEKRRTEARIAALAAEIHDGGRPHVFRRPEPDLDLRRSIDSPLPLSPSGLFENGAPAPASPRLATVVGIGVLVFGALAAVAIVLGTGSSAATARVEAPTAEHAIRPAAAESPVPLELLALGHERDGDRLTVRGIVRNPSVGREVDRVTAVVFLYDRNGGFLTSGRAAIESPSLAPGGESTFVVVVPGASDVGRYRVSFRTEDRVVPHVDRRDGAQEKS